MWEAIYIPKAPKGREAPAPGSFELLEQHEGFGMDAARYFHASPKPARRSISEVLMGLLGFRV